MLGRFRSTDPVARHTKWVSCPALGNLLPRLHQRARELLADLAAERARLGTSPAAAATAVIPQSTTEAARPCSASIGDIGHAWGEYARPAAADVGPLGEASRRIALHAESQTSRVQRERARKPEDQLRIPSNDTPHNVGGIKSVTCDGGEVRASQLSSTATARRDVAGKQAEKQLASLRKECETSRIVVHALHEKNEESQVKANGS